MFEEKTLWVTVKQVMSDQPADKNTQNLVKKVRLVAICLVRNKEAEKLGDGTRGSWKQVDNVQPEPAVLGMLTTTMTGCLPVTNME